jgi:hypothetical protein
MEHCPVRPADPAPVTVPEPTITKGTALSRRHPGKPVGEHEDHYPHVVVRWEYSDSVATRIIECKNRIQWIIQHRKGGRWRSQSFCTTRAGLERLVPGKATELRASLPLRFGGR